MMTWYFEDFQPGQVIDAGWCGMEADELDAFARRYDPQSFHIDPAAAANSIYGGIIASGWHTCGLMMRQMVDTVLGDSASMGSPGIDQIRWLAPVRAGDRLHVTAHTLDVRASQSKPDRGIVHWEWQAHNQDGVLVATITSKGMIGRRPTQEKI
ncbi:MaoC family dehydratase [Massilia sp. W12]|uniref:MaoC family dehydratase n=1 Tax=Massilia sp. W12 TaxID=3126507 RepID=UPI0030CC3335